MKSLLTIVCSSFLLSAALAQEVPTLKAHFHHVHLNVTDPEAAANFYTAKFACEKAPFADKKTSVWAQKSWLLFNRVKQAPALSFTSTIWHIGWGAEDMKATYQKQLAMGTKFFEPLNDISDIGGNAGARDLFFYAYVQSPDNALIELNTARHHNFGHLHLFSNDPIGTAEWWGKNFGVKLSPALKNPKAREPRIYRNVPIAPSASFNLDNVNIIVYPAAYPKQVYAAQWQGKTDFESTRGKAVDHIALSVDNLTEMLKELKANGVKIMQKPKNIPGTKIKSAFIEAPDKLVLELVEGHADKTAAK